MTAAALFLPLSDLSLKGDSIRRRDDGAVNFDEVEDLFLKYVLPTSELQGFASFLGDG